MAWPEFENGWQSPRISFALDLSQTDRTSPDKRSRVGTADIIHSPDFEFCKVSNVNGGRIADFGETFISADVLFGDGMILPRIRTTEAQPLTIARHLSLETSGCPSPVRSASYPPSKESGVHAAFKSAHRPSGRWKEMFKLSNKDYFCAAGKEADQDAKESINDVKPSPARSRWPFSRSGGERRGNALFCALPFSRSKSAVERNKSVPCSEASCCRSKSVGAQTAYKETQTLLVSGPKPVDAKCEDDKRLPDLPKRKGSPGRAMRSCPAKTYGRGSPGRGGNNRFVVRNSKTLDSPRPGKSMAEGSLKTSYNIPGVNMKVNPVLNVPAYIGPVGGRNGPGLFGFRGLFSKKDSNKRSHHTQYTASRKKGA